MSRACSSHSQLKTSIITLTNLKYTKVALLQSSSRISPNTKLVLPLLCFKKMRDCHWSKEHAICVHLTVIDVGTVAEFIGISGSCICGRCISGSGSGSVS